MHLRWSSALAVAVACLTLVVAACSNGDSTTATPTPTPPSPTPGPSGSTASIDECALVTPAELDQVIPGQAFAAGTVPRLDFCDFHGTEDLVTIGTADLGTPAAAAEGLQASVAQTTSNPVTGVGDVAYWQPNKNQLAIILGSLGIVVDVFVGTGDVSQSTEATAIAQIVLPRLP